MCEGGWKTLQHEGGCGGGGATLKGKNLLSLESKFFPLRVSLEKEFAYQGTRYCSYKVASFVKI